MKRLTTAIILLAIPALVIAGPRRVIKKQMMTEKRMNICERLNLTDEQQEKMHDLRVAHQKKVIPLQAKLKLAHLDLEELIREGDTSKKLNEAIKNVSSLKGNQLEMQVKHRIKIGKILTDEQGTIWQKYHNYRKKGYHPRGRGDRFGMMGGGPCMPYMFDGPEADPD